MYLITSIIINNIHRNLNRGIPTTEIYLHGSMSFPHDVFDYAA